MALNTTQQHTAGAPGDALLVEAVSSWAKEVWAAIQKANKYTHLHDVLFKRFDHLHDAIKSLHNPILHDHQCLINHVTSIYNNTASQATSPPFIINPSARLSKTGVTSNRWATRRHHPINIVNRPVPSSLPILDSIGQAHSSFHNSSPSRSSRWESPEVCTMWEKPTQLPCQSHWDKHRQHLFWVQSLQGALLPCPNPRWQGGGWGRPIMIIGKGWPRGDHWQQKTMRNSKEADCSSSWGAWAIWWCIFFCSVFFSFSQVPFSFTDTLHHHQMTCRIWIRSPCQLGENRRVGAEGHPTQGREPFTVGMVIWLIHVTVGEHKGAGCQCCAGIAKHPCLAGGGQPMPESNPADSTKFGRFASEQHNWCNACPPVCAPPEARAISAPDHHSPSACPISHTRITTFTSAWFTSTWGGFRWGDHHNHAKDGFKQAGAFSGLGIFHEAPEAGMIGQDIFFCSGGFLFVYMHLRGHK